MYYKYLDDEHLEIIKKIQTVTYVLPHAILHIGRPREK